jgi:hypothetical protein
MQKSGDISGEEKYISEGKADTGCTAKKIIHMPLALQPDHVPESGISAVKRDS